MTTGAVLDRRRPEIHVAAPLGFVLGLAIVLFARWGPDWPAQEFRGWTAAHDGLLSWTNSWYSGEALPGYSVLYPPLAALLGTGLTGLLATTAAAAFASRLAPSGGRTRVIGYHVAVAVGLAENLLIGQVPFLVGVAFALGAVWAVRRSAVLTAVLAIGASLASPLAGAFLLLAAPALALALGRRRVLPLAGALVGIGVSALVGGAGGPFPAGWQTPAAVGGFGLVTLLVTTRADRALRCFAASYVVCTVAVFLVPNPIGGNITRLGKLVALPLACYCLSGDRLRRLVRNALVIALATVWPVIPFAGAIERGAGDPSQHQAYYRGLLGFLATQNPTGRLEIPFTREHWEALWVARAYPLARGWERQTDLQDNAVLYHPLTPAAYLTWLDANSISLVALPTAPIDYGGQAEAALLRHPPSYLTPVWHDANWQVWRVTRPTPLVSGAATLTNLGTASFTLDFAHPGAAVVRIHANRLWQVSAGPACIDGTSGWLVVRSTAAGPVTARAALNTHLLTGNRDCDA